MRIEKPWRGERGPAIGAGATLLVIMAGHAMRETARDTLFLTHLPAERLPWAYLAIAVLALVAAAVSRGRLVRWSHRSMLVGSLLLAGAVDVGFWWLAENGFDRTPFALYVWTGLASTAVTVLFWLHLADLFDVGEAKRSFALVAAGGLAGAVCGSAAAGAVLASFDTRTLLLGSSALSVAAAWLPVRGTAQPIPDDAGTGEVSRSATWDALRSDSYLRRVLVVSALVAVLGTGIDFLFKSAVAMEIPRDQLGPFFARFNAAVNAGALLFQLFVAAAVLQAIGVTRAIAVLPTALLIGSAAAAATTGMLPVLLLKGADATLRHSLYRASTEILYLPLAPRLRSTFKILADSVGQRGGQALASLGILLAVSVHAAPRDLAIALFAVSALVLGSLVGLRRDYVARFRDQLRSLNPVARRSVPRLELHSLEVLVSSLSSPNDAEVLSALDLLEAYGKTSLVTPLILRHPSSAVVVRALELLSGSDHPHIDPLIERLLVHDDAAVRAAALHRYAARVPGGPQLLRAVREDPSFAVRAMAFLLWVGPQGDRAAVDRLIGEVLASGERDARLALARVLPQLPFAPIADALRTLLADPEPAYAAEMAQAACADPKPEQIPLLLELLARREARPTARAALLELGEPALRTLSDALDSDATSDAVRRHLPRTISRFANARAAEILVRAAEAGDARVRYKALRGLGRMRANAPALAVASESLVRVAEGSLQRAVTLLYYDVAHAAWSELHSFPSDGPDLLGPLLLEMQQSALEHVFRALHVLEPEQEYGVIFDALHRGGPHRAGSREILEHLVDGRLRDGLLAMLGTDEPRERLRQAAPFFEPDGAKDLLDLLPAASQANALSLEQRDPLERSCQSAFAAIERDSDPVLVSVARHRREAVGDRHGR